MIKKTLLFSQMDWLFHWCYSNTTTNHRALLVKSIEHVVDWVFGFRVYVNHSLLVIIIFIYELKIIIQLIRHYLFMLQSKTKDKLQCWIKFVWFIFQIFSLTKTIKRIYKRRSIIFNNLFDVLSLIKSLNRIDWNCRINCLERLVNEWPKNFCK